MDHYQRIAYGLKQVFWTKLMLTLCEVLPPIVFLAGWILASDGLIYVLYFFYFGRILFPALCTVCLYGMGNDIGTFKKAAALCLADVIALVISFIVHIGDIDNVTYIMRFAAEGSMSMYDEYLEGAAAWIDLIAGVVHCIALLLVVYFVCTSVAAVMKEIGDDKIAEFSKKVWMLHLLMGVLYMIVLFRPGLSFADERRFAGFVVSIFYLRFLQNSYRALDAQEEEEKK